MDDAGRPPAPAIPAGDRAAASEPTVLAGRHTTVRPGADGAIPRRAGIIPRGTAPPLWSGIADLAVFVTEGPGVVAVG
jgi:hypothetical protein